MVKGFRQIALLTTLSRVLGMVRDMVFAFFLGRSNLMDIWVIAFKIPNLTRRIFGEGALSSSFIPVYIEQLQENPTGAQCLARTVVTVLFLLLAGLVLIAQGMIHLYCRTTAPLVDTELMLLLTMVMLPYMLLVCSVAAVAGILHSHRRFTAPALAPIVLNVIVISSLSLSGWIMGWEPECQLGFVASGVLVAGLCQLAIQVPSLRACGITLRPCWQIRSDPFKKIMFLMAPMILGLTVTQLNTLADDVIAKIFSASVTKGDSFVFWGRAISYPVEAGAVSSLFYAQRLYQFPLGVLGISLATALFPVMSTNAAHGRNTALAQTISRGIAHAVSVAIPATVGLFLIGRPLVSAIFEQGHFTYEDSPIVARALFFYAIGLSGYFVQQIVTRAFYSLQDSRAPCGSALIAVFTNIILNLILIWYLRTEGLALATALCSYLQCMILIRHLHRRLGTSVLQGVGRTISSTMVATIVMASVTWLVMNGMSDWPTARGYQVIRLAIGVPVAAGVYLIAAKVLGLGVLTLLWDKHKDAD